MDLKTLIAPQPPIDVPLLFDDKGIPTVGVKVVGADSEQYRQAERANKVKNLKESALRGSITDMKTDQGAAEATDIEERRDFEIAMGCIVEIYGVTGDDGKPLEVSKENLSAIFNGRPTFLKRICAVIERQRVFTRG